METSRITKCPGCGAETENLAISAYVDLRFKLKQDKCSNLTIDLDRLSEITKEDIIEGIDETGHDQEIFCRKCGIVFKGRIDWDSNGEMIVFGDPDKLL